MGIGNAGDDHHGDGQAEVELHEAQAIDVALAGGGDERDGAGLGGHDGEAHGVPGHGFAGEQKLVDGLAAAAAIESVEHQGGERGDQREPIEPASCEGPGKQPEQKDIEGQSASSTRA